MKTATYMRISTEKHQDTALQEQAIMRFLQYKEFTDIQIYCDKGFTGSNRDRLDLKRLLDDVKTGTIERVIVWKFDRLSRSLSDLLDLIRTFKEHNVSLVSVSENIDLSTPMGNTMMQVVGAFAELERATIIERTIAGMAAKKAQGLHMGRKSKLTRQQELEVIDLRNQGNSYGEIVKETGLSLGCVKGVLKRNRRTV